MTEILEILRIVFLQPLNQLYLDVVDVSPELIIVIVSLSLSYLISHFLGWLVGKTLYKTRIDKHIRVENLKDSFGATSLATIFGSLAKWGLFILFADKIFSLISLGVFSGIIIALFLWLKRLMLVLLTIVIGLLITDFFTLKIFIAKNEFLKNVRKIIRVILIMVIFFTVLEQLGLKLMLAETIFLMIIGSILFTLALAIGIGLGMGLKEDAKKIIKKYLKKLK